MTLLQQLPYLYNTGLNLYFNETKLNQTIQNQYSVKLNSSGDTMTGNLNMSGNNIMGVSYIIPYQVSGACDLTISGICKNASFTYYTG
jgi:hypothetical protein